LVGEETVRLLRPVRCKTNYLTQAELEAVAHHAFYNVRVGRPPKARVAAENRREELRSMCGRWAADLARHEVAYFSEPPARGLENGPGPEKHKAIVVSAARLQFADLLRLAASRKGHGEGCGLLRRQGASESGARIQE